MGEVLTMAPVEHIGETAGIVWRYLRDSGPISLATLVKDLGEPRDLVMQAIGWLAREGKIDIMDSKRKKTITLKDNG